MSHTVGYNLLAGATSFPISWERMWDLEDLGPSFTPNSTQGDETRMSTDRIRLLVDLNIHQGKFAEFEAIVKQMAAVSEQERGTLGYQFYLSADRTRCCLVEGYTDVAAIRSTSTARRCSSWCPRCCR